MTPSDTIMTKQMTTLTLLSLLLLLPLTGRTESPAKDYTEAFELMRVWLDAQRDYDRLPGISVAILENQEVLWADGFGCANVDEQLPFTPETIGSICSISKLFTSVAIMKLYDDGKLRLDDRIEDLLPWYNLEQAYPESGPVTVRTLLTHSSGLPRESDFPYWIGPDYPFPSRAEIMQMLPNQSTLYPSSTYFQYSNLAMTLLGEIVREVSGMPYDEYVQTYILDPLELSDTRTYMPEELWGAQLAHGWSVLQRDGTRNRENFFEADGIMAAAGFSSTVMDLARFATWQLRLLETNTPEILKPSTLRYMQNVHYTDPSWETTWGLGFSVRKADDGTHWVGHGGYCPGYQSALQIHPTSNRAYSVIINANGVSPLKYVRGVHGILSKVTSKSAEILPEDLPDLGPFTGYYRYNQGERYLGSWEGRLFLITLPNDSPAASMTFYRHTEGDTFHRLRPDGSKGEPMTFHRDEQGRVSHFMLHQMHYVKQDGP